jgi:hypothetical protein
LANCGESIYANRELGSKTFLRGNKFTIKCSEDCFETDKEEVYGKDIYADSSFLCGAAIHSGAIERNGGRFTIEIKDPEQLYISRL